MRKILIIAIVIVSCSCREIYQRPKVAGDRIKIVATTSILGDALKNIVGDKAEIFILMGAGTDPHMYKPAYADVRKLIECDAIFYHGLHLEGKMEDMLVKLQRIKKVVRLSDALSESDLFYMDDKKRLPDPHIWHDVNLWQLCMLYAAKAMAEIDEKNTSYYTLQSEKYLLELRQTDNLIRDIIKDIPPKKRIVVTAHNAFGYLGRAYGLEMKSLKGISTVSEFGLYNLSHMIDYIIENEIMAIFPENSVPEKLMFALAEGCEKNGWKVCIAPALYSDALGDAGGKAGTYIDMVLFNIEIIAEYLKKTAHDHTCGSTRS
ncbi:MAG: zinc ABC transporter substrate-binding protein [Cyclobacteriaceae bacterium]|nr:zinc ABC transporter substrate-binding protein [Cyclobacteriaceae bacterium]